MNPSPERIRSIVAGIGVGARPGVAVRLLDDPPPNPEDSSTRAVILAHSDPGWCIAVHEGDADEAHAVFFAGSESTRTTPRWRRAHPSDGGHSVSATAAERATRVHKSRSASEAAVLAMLPRLERAIASALGPQSTALEWDLVELPFQPDRAPEAARVLLLAAWLARSRLPHQSQLRRLDKLRFLPDWAQGLAELERGSWAGAGFRVCLTAAQARKRTERTYSDAVYATGAEIAFQAASAERAGRPGAWGEEEGVDVAVFTQ